MPQIRRKESNHRMITLVGSLIFPITARAVVRNPSKRLNCSIKAYYEFTGTTIVNYDTVEDYNTVWRIRGRDPGSGSLGQPYLSDFVRDTLDPPRIYELPNVFEVNTGVEQIQVELNMTDAVRTSGGTAIGTGNWYLKASWEPAPGSDISDEELEELFDRCSIDGTLVTQST